MLYFDFELCFYYSVIVASSPLCIMLPVKVNKGVVTEMLLMKDQTSCCYGATPGLNDFVIVRLPEGKGKLMVDTPIFVYGTLKVGAVIENGFLSGVYQLDGESMKL